MTDQPVSQNIVPVGGEFQVNTYTVGEQSSPSITSLTDGRFVVLWASEQQDNSASSVYGQIFNADGSSSGNEFAVNTFTGGQQRYPAIASLANGGFVATWESQYQDGSYFGIYSQVYDSSGSRVGDEFRVNTITYLHQMSPSATGLDDGGFVVTWMSENQDSGGRDGYSWGVYGQLYSSAGNPIGGEFRVNTEVSYAQEHPTISSLTNGGFVVAWSSQNQDGGDTGAWGVYGQVFSSDGIAVGSEFRVNSHTEHNQDSPAITGLAGGGFAVTWRSVGAPYYDDQDGSGSGVFCQIFNSDGTVLGGEFRVNSYTLGEQKNPAITKFASGGFIVTWFSYDQDLSNDGVYAQIYSETGAPVGGEFRVNSYTDSAQNFPSITNLDGSELTNLDGSEFAVAWMSHGQDGSGGYGVYGQLFHVGNVSPVGIPEISGIADESQVLSADAAGVTDTDGINQATLTYQWLRDGSEVIGATNGIYTLTQADVGSQFSVRFGYTDNFGTLESVLSIATSMVQNVNDGPVGSVLISGTATQGQVLTANTAGVTDLDGIDVATRAYQWLRGGNVIADATNSTYTLSSADIGSAISVRFFYIDNFGINETVTSAATALVQTTIFNGTSAADILFGNSYDNSLLGLAGNDTIYGGLGSDILYGGDGNDILDGGAGVDTAVFTATTATKVDFGLKTRQATGQGTDTLVNIENVTSGSGNDTLRGSVLDNLFLSGAGNDQLFGSSGNDSLYAEAGNDTLQGDAGDDYLDGGLGTDTAVYTGATATTVDLTLINPQNTGQGVDTLINIENVITGTGADAITGDELANVLKSGDGNDTLTGGSGNDTIDGGAGIDRLILKYPNEIDADSGIYVSLISGYAVETYRGISYTDVLLDIEDVGGSEGNDVIIGSNINNWLNGNAGNDAVSGLNGNDFIQGQQGDDSLSGGRGNDTIFGDDRSGVPSFDDGDDTLQGDLGDDFLVGGSGIDTASYIGTTAVQVDLSLSTAQVTGYGRDTLLDIENVTSGSGADVLKGNSSDNILTSGGGNDQLFGSSGNDSLYAEAGNDTLQGDVGDDYLDGGNGSDTAVYVGAAATVDLALLTAQDTGYGLDTFANIENVTSGIGGDSLYGNALANILTGNDGADLLSGNDGNDSLYGGLGNDTLHGGAGTDSLDAGIGNDSILFGTGDDLVYGGDGDDVVDDVAGTQVLGNNLIYGGTGNDSVWAGDGQDTIYGGTGNDSLTSDSGNDQIYGDDGNDTLVGVVGNDSLYGGNGNDVLEGSTGNDALTGGAGSDVFVFNTGDGRDSITDFLNATDRFQIAIGAENFGQLTVTDSGRNVLISFSDVTITLVNVDHKLIGAEDFIFV